MASNPYGYDEGSIEENTTYRPEFLGEVQFETGTAEQVWEEYAMELVPIQWTVDGKWEDSGKRAIMRNGQLLEVVSEDYKLLPNEEMVSAADEVADRLGAVPFDEFGGDWYIKLNEHVFQDPDGRRAHALYAWDDPVDLGYGDEVQLGFAVHNSIDSSMGLRVGLFTFRHACANMVFMGVDTDGMSFDERNVIRHSSRKHTKGLDIDNLEAWVENTVEHGPTVIDCYQRWVGEELSPDTARWMLERAGWSNLSIRKDIPGWMQEAREMINEAERRAEENEQLGEQFEDGLPDHLVAQIIEGQIPKGETTWDLYNDMTANIWHSPDTNDQSKIQKMKQVHRGLGLGTDEVSFV